MSNKPQIKVVIINDGTVVVSCDQPASVHLDNDQVIAIDKNCSANITFYPLTKVRELKSSLNKAYFAIMELREAGLI